MAEDDNYAAKLVAASRAQLMDEVLRLRGDLARAERQAKERGTHALELAVKLSDCDDKLRNQEKQLADSKLIYDHVIEKNKQLFEDLMALTEELNKLKAKPPMACVTCEELNLELHEEIERHKAFQTREGRESIALNAYVAGYDDRNDIPVDVMMSEDGMKPIIAKFKKWWGYHHDLIEQRATTLTHVALNSFERIVLASFRDKTEDVFAQKLIDRITGIKPE